MSRRKGGKNPYRGDRFTKSAKEQGYAARSVYKLSEIQRRFRLFKPGDRVVDLGCCPGSWLAYATEQVGRRGAVVGVDLDEMSITVPGAMVLHDDIRNIPSQTLFDCLGGRADVVLSDMAPRTTGNVLGDHVAQIELASLALDRAQDLLKFGGHFVVKIFDGEDAPGWVLQTKKLFNKCKRVRPEAVRKNSREFFLVCQGYKGRPGEQEQAQK